jgi:hypothetical protein
MTIRLFSVTPIALTPEQIAAARRFLTGVGEKTRARGEAYFRENAVLKIEVYKRGVGFRSAVSGGALYHTKLRFEDGAWSGECTCPVFEDCKHAVATLLAGLQMTGANGAAPAIEPRPTVAEDETFLAAVTARLGRKLTVIEQRLASVVDELFLQFGEAKVIPEMRLDAITGKQRADSWNRNTVSVWPEPPASPWEAWLYIAAYLRRHGLPCRPLLVEITDWAEVDALVQAWERREQVEKWREWLKKSAPLRHGREPQSIELRVRLTVEGAQLESRKDAIAEFAPLKAAPFAQFVSDTYAGRVPFDEASLPVWHAFHTGYGSQPFRGYSEPDCARILNTLLRLPGGEDRVVGPTGAALRRAEEALAWRVEPSADAAGDYRLALVLPDGSAPSPALTVIDGEPSLYVTGDTVFPGPPLGALTVAAEPVAIPAEALESSEGVALLDRLGVPPPPRLAGRIRDVRMRTIFRCALEKDKLGDREWLIVTARAESAPGVVEQTYGRDGWQRLSAQTAPEDEIVRMDRTALEAVPGLIEALRVNWNQYDSHWQRQVGRPFPQQFTEWLALAPSAIELELDPLLATLRGAPIKAGVKLEVEEADIDWFDLKVALDVEDTTLTKKEIKMLLDARGGFVRLGEKGWRRLAFELSPEDEAQLADLGLSAREFSSEPQRLHALQLAGKSAARRLLSEGHAAVVERRAMEIKTRVSPPVPPDLLAELRPYQLEGFHFLAYLTANRFGGILADDMGLGKTVQALAWLLWLRSDGAAQPSLVVCPKSVVDNWSSEAARFAPGLRVHVLARGNADAAALKSARAACDLVVINYAQLRSLEKALTAAPWHAAILDEAQYIKNPESQTAHAAYALKATHRLALSGTPIENRLLDLWSIMSFAMPGVLGRRSDFSKNFDQRSDPLARVRLAARVRPFVLRRTKGEVAKDLPERIEEDLLCELDGEQATLYRAELKRARAELLKINTAAQLGEARFNILTSLLRLRQICCHPALVSAKAAGAESAKLNALLDVLEPLMEEGHKVLVFSQFVEMLELIRAEVVRREWRHFLLTGQTEDRGPLVADFQSSEGAAVFLISLRAGGFGLNLTAASYVVLYDPWWNPAVEAQAIDRTHRIGQRSQVIAYRLLVKHTIEEKIRHLQKQKSSLAADILGEENFARALTLEDFHFLLGD